MEAHNATDHTGLRIGRLVAIRRDGTYADKRGKKKALWLFQCDCGGTRTMPMRAAAQAAMAGCLDCAAQRQRDGKRKHGGTLPADKRLYGIWKGMRQRCHNSRRLRYERYGGRGITICDEWDDFAVFMTWAKANGYRADLTIERMDPDKGYNPANCEWITLLENVARIFHPKIGPPRVRAARAGS
jgi:hypothetical protein